MAKIKFHEFSNGSVIFREKDSFTDEVKIVDEVEYSPTPDTDKEALSLIQRANTAARKGHAGAMRFILTALQNMNPAYGGMGSTKDEEGAILFRNKVTTEDDRKQLNGYKEAFRDASDALMFPILVEAFKGDDVKARAELKALRGAGVFAVSSSMARKFFWFTGKLPCAYDAQGKPDISRALAVSAMQRIIAEIPEEESDAHTFAAKVRALMKEWETKNGRTESPNDMSALLGYLDAWREQVRDAEIASLSATTGAMLPTTRAYEGTTPAVSKPVEEALM